MCAANKQPDLAPEATANVPRARLLGAPIDPIRLTTLLAWVAARAQKGTITTVLYVNIHCLNVAFRDRQFAAILESADLVYCDGTGVKLAAAMTGQRIPERLTGADWIWELADVAARDGLSLFFLGSAPGSAEDAGRILRRRFPRLRIAGTASGYGAGADVVNLINASSADILLVGMGTPTQEKWIASHRHELRVPVVWAVGALFDFVSGRIPRGPRFLTDHGFEWACRLWAEPKKLWRRYLIGNPLFFWRVIRWHWLEKNP